MTFKRFVVLLAILGAVVCLPLYGYKVAVKKDYSDFDVYYRTAARVQAGAWNDVYNFEIDGNCPYRYAPPTLPLFEPMTVLPLAQSRLLWFFLQVGFYGMGFFLLRKTIRAIRLEQGLKDNSLFILASSFLFVLRFMIDSFTIGQVTGLMFLGFTISLAATIARKPLSSVLALAFPALCKVGPLILLGPTFSFDRKRFKDLLLSLVMTSAGAFLFTLIWFHDWDRTLFLWRGWLKVLAGDSTFFDASHYGTQSIKSALMRFSAHGWIVPQVAENAWRSIVALGTISMSVFWFLRVPQSSRGMGLFFGLAVFGYLWFMPETFKYSQPFLAIPMAMLLTGPITRYGRFAIAFGFATLSLAGLDLVGSTVFFAVQKASIPLLASLMLGAEVIFQAVQESAPRRFHEN